MVVPLEAVDDDAFRTIDHDEARALLETGAVTVLDVRTPGEYEQLGHIPGAWLMPVDLVASAPADVCLTIEQPLLVYCEHGVRSVRRVASCCAAAGIERVLNLAGGLAALDAVRASLARACCAARRPG